MGGPKVKATDSCVVATVARRPWERRIIGLCLAQGGPEFMWGLLSARISSRRPCNPVARRLLCSASATAGRMPSSAHIGGHTRLSALVCALLR
ncbi:hypothetical protein AAFF_G00049400 [Aldrovandia affinis]|uniref:Uncharacterized protein n=1 Tax=Aldrovandia affinis TaxID=143900 RepID=A0AAD7S1B4_9TELE|nr:hypothetical protein AAFF_G00049400 [Aldrovandia affinis]